jgi:hypothetical protein
MVEGTNAWIILRGCRGNNVQAIDVAVPRNLFTCVTCVSGSGTSTHSSSRIRQSSIVNPTDTPHPRLLYVQDPHDRGALHHEGNLGRARESDSSLLWQTSTPCPVLLSLRSKRRGRCVDKVNDIAGLFMGRSFGR